MNDAVEGDLLLDLLGPRAKQKRLNTLVLVLLPLRDGANDGCLAVARQASLQDPRELGVAIVDVASGVGRACLTHTLEHRRECQQGLVDV